MVVGIKDIPVHQRCTITTSLGSLEILPEFIYTPERGFVTFFFKSQDGARCFVPEIQSAYSPKVKTWSFQHKGQGSVLPK